MAEARPDPDQLLERVNAEEARDRRGRLRIFFGASAGVGKTYAMLEAAHSVRAGGTDVVVGYVEPHGRVETERLLEGLPRLPALSVNYRGIVRLEFDLDGALARKPEILIVDELAHSNITGGEPPPRHPKRWQDIMELLAAGISVWTTVNVQHLESLNDLILQTTGVLQRETLPDHVFDEADDIELIDLPPDDLIARLHAGKVYVGDQAGTAVERFFRKSNLLALREIALRRVADRVEAATFFADVFGDEVFDRQRAAMGRLRRPHERIAHRASDDHLHQFSGIGLARGDRRQPAAITKNGHSIGDAEDLVQSMSDVDDADVAGAQSPQGVEQAFDVGLGKRRGRFIENEDV